MTNGRGYDIRDLWRDDFVAFAIGCSFTFEDALMAEGIELRHIDQNKTVGMFITNIETEPAGPFSGGTVVSMRPLKITDAVRASAICARFPHAHGAARSHRRPCADRHQGHQRPRLGRSDRIQRR